MNSIDVSKLDEILKEIESQIRSGDVADDDFLNALIEIRNILVNYGR